MSSSNNDKQTKEVVDGFRKLREHQTQLVNQLKMIEGDLREIYGVINVLKTFDPSRKVLYRLGDTLIKADVEQHLKDKTELFNALSNEMKQSNRKLVEKSEEINTYQRTHSIRVLTEDEIHELEQKNQISYQKY